MGVYVEIIVDKKNGHGPSRRIRASMDNLKTEISGLRNNEVIRHVDIIQHQVLESYSFTRADEVNAREYINDLVEKHEVFQALVDPDNWTDEGDFEGLSGG